MNAFKGFAAQKKEVLLGVANARAKVGSIQATPERFQNPEVFARFRAPGGAVETAGGRREPQRGGALSQFQSVRECNVAVRSFRSNLTAKAFSDEVRLGSTLDNEKEISPAAKVEFGASPAGPAGMAPANGHWEGILLRRCHRKRTAGPPGEALAGASSALQPGPQFGDLVLQLQGQRHARRVDAEVDAEPRGEPASAQ